MAEIRLKHRCNPLFITYLAFPTQGRWYNSRWVWGWGSESHMNIYWWLPCVRSYAISWCCDFHSLMHASSWISERLKLFWVLSNGVPLQTLKSPWISNVILGLQLSSLRGGNVGVWVYWRPFSESSHCMLAGKWNWIQAHWGGEIGLEVL